MVTVITKSLSKITFQHHTTEVVRINLELSPNDVRETTGDDVRSDQVDDLQGFLPLFTLIRITQSGASCPRVLYFSQLAQVSNS